MYGLVIIKLGKMPLFLCNRTVSYDPPRPLPHTLYPVAGTDLCLITKREKGEAKEFLKEKKVEGVNKVGWLHTENVHA